jgi:hypothetical protein
MELLTLEHEMNGTAVIQCLTLRRTVPRVTPLAEQGIAPPVPPLIDALDKSMIIDP